MSIKDIAPPAPSTPTADITTKSTPKSDLIPNTMGTRGLRIVRFQGRYYIQHNQYDSYYEGLGRQVVESVPSDPEHYQKWLQMMRAEYAAEEGKLEQHVYKIRHGEKPDTSLLHAFEYIPTELPKIGDFWHEYFYIIDLDREIPTMNFSIHWKLNNIPRDGLWLRAIVESIYPGKPTISLDICPEEHMACPALDLREPNREVGYNSTAVTLKNMDVQEARTIFLTGVIASTLIEYHDTIIRFGREWKPESFPFRELTFALVSIASGQAKFHSFHVQPCDPRECGHGRCRLSHLRPRESHGWLDEKWAGDYAPLPEFGSMSHQPGDPPGASPMETKYWVEDVLVSLTLVVDGEAITEAVTWGIKQGRAGFQIVVLSLFQVAYAEVFLKDSKPFVRASEAVNLSPLLAEYCVSTHPRERPELKPGMQEQRQGETAWEVSCTGTPKRLRDHFPGLMSLVKFFDVAGSRRAASKSVNSGAGQGASSKAPVILPPEMHDRILDFVDYDTWKTCLVVSPKFRSYCLRKFRVDNRMRIVAGPLAEESIDSEPRMSFDFEDAQTGEISWRMQAPRDSRRMEECSWMPLIGTDRKALMSEVVFQFKTVSKRRKLAGRRAVASEASPPTAIGTTHASSRTRAVPKADAQSRRRGTRRRPGRSDHATASRGGSPAHRKGPKGQRAKSAAILPSAKACKTKTPAETDVPRSRFGRRLQRPNRYGFPNPKMLGVG